MVTIEKLKVSDVILDKELLTEYGQESSIEGMPTPEAQIDTYKVLETTGMFHVFGAYTKEEKMLIGYITILLSFLPHYGATVAVSESFFVAKRYRKTGAGLSLLHTAEQYAISQGAVGFLASAPVGGSLSQVLPNVGYRHTNEVFFRSL